MSSIGIRNGLSMARSGIGMYLSTASISSSIVFSHCGFAVQSAQRADPDHRQIVAGELILREQFADFELDQFEQFGIVDHVDLVQRDHDVGHTDLTGEQDVLTRLGHGAVGGGARPGSRRPSAPRR